MKNREKYRKTIMELSRNMDVESLCRFRKRYVIPKLYEDIAQGSCNNVNCEWCKLLLYIWLDEEYEEYEEPLKPEVDWSKVPVDTLVRVRDLESEQWNLRYFKGIDEEAPEFRFVAWDAGETSLTACGNYTHWAYCELVEEEIDQLLKGGDVIDH